MPNPGYFPPQFQQQAEKPVMHPVVPQPGTQNRYIPTQPFPQPGNYSSELSKPVNVVTPIPAPTPAKPGSNLDLLSGIDLTPTHRIDSPIIHDQFISSEPSPVPVKLPDTPHNTETVSQRKVRPPMFVIDTDKLKQETEKLQSFVNSLSQKTLQGSVPLDSMWKDANDSVSRCGNKLSVSVGRCYPLKNRAPDVLPFDQSRIELKFSKVVIWFINFKIFHVSSFLI
jgi:tyrosine-protein phosphatase non-receptor type 23